MKQDYPSSPRNGLVASSSLASNHTHQVLNYNLVIYCIERVYSLSKLQPHLQCQSSDVEIFTGEQPLELWSNTGYKTLNFGNDTSTCNSGRSGRLRYTGGTTWEYCNGTAWTASGLGSSFSLPINADLATSPAGQLFKVGSPARNLLSFSSNSGGGTVYLGDTAGNVSTGAWNTFIGAGAGAANTTGNTNVFVGRYAGNANTTGGGNTYIGPGAGMNATASTNVFIGQDAGKNAGNGNNVFIGSGIGQNTSQGNNTFVGVGAGSSSSNSGSFNVLMGYQAGAVSTNG